MYIKYVVLHTRKGVIRKFCIEQELLREVPLEFLVQIDQLHTPYSCHLSHDVIDIFLPVIRIILTCLSSEITQSIANESRNLK